MDALDETRTPTEVAQILKRYPCTVIKLARKGKLPAFNVAGVVQEACY